MRTSKKILLYFNFIPPVHFRLFNFNPILRSTFPISLALKFRLPLYLTSPVFLFNFYSNLYQISLISHVFHFNHAFKLPFFSRFSVISDFPTNLRYAWFFSQSLSRSQFNSRNDCMLFIIR